jgi:CheY-like chemotaxis protein
VKSDPRAGLGQLPTYLTIMNKPEKEIYHVLVADDSTDDRFLLQSAMKRVSRLRIVAEVADGSEVIAYLKGHGPYADRERYPMPDLLLLDLKMPQMDGFEVLEWMQSESFSGPTVVVLTDSMQAEHIKRALDLGADLFQVKPRGNPDRETMVLALEEFLAGSVKARAAN